MADEPQKGFVHVSFTDDQIAAVLASIEDVRSRGALLGDIAVLVRSKSDGAAVAEALRLEGVNFISDDTLDLKGAVSVRRLTSLLSFYDDPANTVGSYLAKSMQIEYPEHYHSLIDFCESLLREMKRFDPATFEAETLFIGAFMDRLQEWTNVNGNNLKAFLRDWNDKTDCYIGSPATSDAVRIMTVHKSKGLEFPHVIFPYAHKVLMFKSSNCWCALDGGGSALGHIADGIYPVDLSGSSTHTLFAGAYEQERQMQLVDNLNIFYVALTRASKSLHVIAKCPAKNKADALKKKRSVDWSNFSEILYGWCGCSEEWTSGEPYDFSLMKRDAPGEERPLEALYPSIPLNGRLRASQDASDFFGDEGAVGPAASGRLRGIQLHAILSSVDSVQDLPSDLCSEDASLLRSRMEAHPEWFASGEARNELNVFGADGSRNRPDRVVHHPDGSISVIDYKFGAERPSYLRQVGRYMKLYRDMGYPSVRGFVWYVPADRVVEV